MFGVWGHEDVVRQAIEFGDRTWGGVEKMTFELGRVVAWWHLA